MLETNSKLLQIPCKQTKYFVHQTQTKSDTNLVCLWFSHTQETHYSFIKHSQNFYWRPKYLPVPQSRFWYFPTSYNGPSHKTTKSDCRYPELLTKWFISSNLSPFDSTSYNNPDFVLFWETHSRFHMWLPCLIMKFCGHQAVVSTFKVECLSFEVPQK